MLTKEDEFIVTPESQTVKGDSVLGSAQSPEELAILNLSSNDYQGVISSIFDEFKK